MSTQDSCTFWVASTWQGESGHAYVRLTEDAPTWVRDLVINSLGRRTVFLPPVRSASALATAGPGNGDELAATGRQIAPVDGQLQARD